MVPPALPGSACLTESPSKSTGRPIIGLAGGIGSGKSTVAAALGELGCVVADADADARRALRDPAIKRAIAERWGDAVFDGAGEIDRAALARIVFAHEAQRRALEQLTHPWIEQRRLEQFGRAAETTPAFVIDAPLLYEAGLDRECDVVIFVDTPRHARLERVRRTRGWDEAELQRREDSQLPLDVKRSRADYVLWNGGTPEDLVARTRSILSEITCSR